MNQKKPIKSLRPSMREKKRYLLIEGKDLRKNVEKCILEFVGIFGLAKTNLAWIKSHENKGIISIDREMLNQIKSCFCVYPEKIQILRVSGTLKGLNAKI